MSQATKTIEINVTPEQFFDVITDYDSYPEYMDKLGMISNKVSSKSDTEAIVESVVKTMGLKEQYTLRYKMDRPRRVSWSLVKGKLTKANDGSWELEETASGKTKAVYSVEASFGWMVPKALIKKGIESQLPKMLEAFKTRAESLHG